MPKITNNHERTPIGLPTGQVIRPGDTAEVTAADWDACKDRQNIKHYLGDNTLTVGEDEKPPAKSAGK